MRGLASQKKMQVHKHRVVSKVDMGYTGKHEEVVHLSGCRHNAGGPLLFRVVPSCEEWMVV